MSEVGDVEVVHGAADHKQQWRGSGDDGVCQVRNPFVDKVGEAQTGVGNADDGMQVGSSQIDVDHQGPKALPGQQHRQRSREKALAGTSLASTDG